MKPEEYIDIESHGLSPKGVPLHSYAHRLDKTGTRYQGALPHLLKESFPEAVGSSQGRLTVNYRMLDIDFRVFSKQQGTFVPLGPFDKIAFFENVMIPYHAKAVEEGHAPTPEFAATTKRLDDVKAKMRATIGSVLGGLQ